MPPECLRAGEMPGREAASSTLGRVKAWAWWVSEFSAVVCTEAVTKQFVQALPGECQLVLVQRWLDPGLLPQKAASQYPFPLPRVNSLHYPSGTAEKPACGIREGTCECVWV